MADTEGILQTPNIGLYKPDYPNIADIQILNENFDKLDKVNAQDVTLYVDASATEAGDGTEEKPFQTVQEAINRGALGKGVVYIEIAEGNYPERIETPRTPHITWRITGTGSVILQGALFDDCNYLVINNLTFSVPTGTVADYAVQVANCNNCAVIDCTINGQASMTSLVFNNSRARLQNIKINNGGIAIAANNNSYVYGYQTSGTNNIAGLHANGSVINITKNDLVATTAYGTIDGGIVLIDGVYCSDLVLPMGKDIYKSADNGMTVSSNPVNSEKVSRLILYPKSGTGAFSLLAGDGTNESILTAYPTGEIYWNSKSLLTQAITNATISGKTITLTFADGTTKTLTTAGYHTGNATAVGGATATKPAVVVETKKSSNNWYRKWSDGYIEQGGVFSASGSGYETLTVNLLAPFSNANYTVITASTNSTGNLGSGVDIIGSKTTSSFSSYAHHKGDVLPTWYACGY